MRLPSTFQDARGRVLEVTAVRPGAHDGREVIGLIRYPALEFPAKVVPNGTPLPPVPARPRPYATDARIFREIWIEEAPPWRSKEQDGMGDTTVKS